MCEHDNSRKFQRYIEDFMKKRLIYPERILGRELNTSFTAPENFVVFECVYRLLTMDCLPEYLELEKAWTLGRTRYHEQV